MSESQSFDNHAKTVPAYHYAASLAILVVFVSAVKQVVGDFSFDAIVSLLAVIGLMLVFWYTRMFALGVQDRVIRLEEQLRMKDLLPEDLRGRISEFTASQLIALRFASDTELPGLARRVLAGEFADRKAIKQAIEDWRADHQRI